MLIRGAVKIDLGKARTKNEDTFGFFPEQAFYVIADGMGGQAVMVCTEQWKSRKCWTC